MSPRSNRPDVRNPMLAIPEVLDMASLPPEALAALRRALQAVSKACRERGEEAWRRHKPPVAAYWKTNAVNARHIACAIAAPKAPRWPMKIGEIRKVIDSAQGARCDLQSHTLEEFVAAGVDERMRRHIGALQELKVPPRYAEDERQRRAAIDACARTIDRWTGLRATAMAAGALVIPVEQQDKDTNRTGERDAC